MHIIKKKEPINIYIPFSFLYLFRITCSKINQTCSLIAVPRSIVLLLLLLLRLFNMRLMRVLISSGSHVREGHPVYQTHKALPIPILFAVGGGGTARRQGMNGRLNEGCETKVRCQYASLLEHLHDVNSSPLLNRVWRR